MKTEKQLVKHYSDNLKKVIALHGLITDYSTHAFFELQAAKKGVKESEINDWALLRSEELKKID